MVTEVNETSIGWPLGLENMNLRLRAIGNIQASSTAPNPSHRRQASFSSFSSSDLDTESTRSFFHDYNSITLGKLIGLKLEDGGFYLTNSINYEEHGQASLVNAASKQCELEVSQGICMPLIMNVLARINPSRKNSSQ